MWSTLTAVTLVWLVFVVAFLVPTHQPKVATSSTITVKGYVRPVDGQTIDEESSTTIAAESAGASSTPPTASTSAAGQTGTESGPATSATAAATVVSVPPFVVPPLAPVVAPTDQPPDNTVVVALPFPVTSGNPSTKAASPNSNAGLGALTLPRPFRTGLRGEPELDTDLMAAVTVVSRQPLIVRYAVRPDAVWSDGMFIGCNDFRLAWMAGGGRYVPFKSEIVPGYQRIAALGCDETGREVTATFSEPDTDWRWLFDGMVPAHNIMVAAEVLDLTAALDDAALVRLAGKWSSSFAIGTEMPLVSLSAGPYVLTSVTVIAGPPASPPAAPPPAASVTLEPNPKWWGAAAASRPVRLITRDPAKLTVDLAAGAVHVAALEPDAALLAAIGAGTGVSVVVGAAFATDELVMNFRNPVLQQRALRQAVGACIERVGLVTSRVAPVIASAQPVANRLIRQYETGFSDTSAGRPTGVERSRELLAGVGFSFGADGLAVKGGKPLRLRVLYPAGASLRAGVVDGLAEQCRAGGIILVPDPQPKAALATAVAAGDFDLLLATTTGRASFQDRLASYQPNGATNWGRYNGSKVTSLARQVIGELDDTERAALLTLIDQELWADVASIPLYSIPDLAVSVTIVTGVSVGPGAAGALASARSWK